MSKNLLFVDGAQIDRSARQQIRSHVMNGKNAGRKVHRRSRLDVVMPPQPPTCRQEQEEFLHHKQSQDEYTTIMHLDKLMMCLVSDHRNLGNPFATLSYPVDPTQYTLDAYHEFFANVVERFYPCRLGVSVDDIKYWWLQCVLADEAAYHSLIAVAEASNIFLKGGGKSSPKVFYHRARALKLVSQRLAGDNALSDSTLALVIMMIIQEQMRMIVPEAQIHYEGLRRLIETRGGLCELEQSPTLVLKVCKMDNVYAWQYGRPISFFRDRMPETRAKLEANGLPFDRFTAESTIRQYNLDPRLKEILLDVTNVSILINNLPSNTRLGYLTFAELIHSIGYRLIQFQPLHQPSSHPLLEEAYHIGLNVFVMSLFMQTDTARLLRCDAVTTRLLSILQRDLTALDSHLVLWLFFVGGMWMRSDYNDSWLGSKIGRLTRLMGLKSWEDTYAVLTGFPWVKVLHDKLGFELYESCTKTNFLYPMN